MGGGRPHLGDAVAVFRYQLYNIDRLLNRTLVYALVTAILGTGYAALVIVQAVDRRFDRRRYDAAGTIERFSGRLREEVDLDMLSGELLGVIDQTMEPTTVWLWLQPRAGPSYLSRMRTG